MALRASADGSDGSSLPPTPSSLASLRVSTNTWDYRPGESSPSSGSGFVASELARRSAELTRRSVASSAAASEARSSADSLGSSASWVGQQLLADELEAKNRRLRQLVESRRSAGSSSTASSVREAAPEPEMPLDPSEPFQRL